MATAEQTAPPATNGTQLKLRAAPNALLTIESIVSQCNLQTIGDAGQFARAFTLAAGMRALKAAITEPMMADILELQGSGLGFRTDKDKDYFAGKGDNYPVESIKLCLIEAVLMGAYPIGNEFNIIADRPYLTKEFYTRKLRELDGLTDLVVQPGVPAMAGDKGALVPFVVSCNYRGKFVKIDRNQHKLEDGTIVDERIAIRVNSGMGADAIIGKATRKIFKQLYERLTGSVTADGDIGDAAPGAALKQPPRSLEQLTDRLSGQGDSGSTDHDGINQGEAHDDADQRTEEERGEALRLPPEHPLYELQAMLDVADTLGAVNKAQASYKGPDSDQLLWSMVDNLAEARREKIRAGRGK